MQKGFRDPKLIIGLLISAVFLYLSFRKVDFARMGAAFAKANYWYAIPGIALMFFSHWLRALRWRYFLAPVQKLDLKTLYSSLLIGYMANTFLPAHLGEFLRAYLVGKKRPVSGSAVFGTIVIERIIDVFTLLLLMALTIIVFPFPEWVQKSGYISFAVILGLFSVLLVMKKHRDTSMNILTKILKPLPHKIRAKIIDLMHSFLDGVVPLKNWKHYIIVTVLSFAIWACYAYIFQIGLYAFGFIAEYDLPWMTAIVLLVITTIAVVVPSSPGYVGTYHYLCQISLAFFAVPKSEGLTYAFVIHGLNFLPILIVGLVLVGLEGMNIRKIQHEAEEAESVAEF